MRVFLIIFTNLVLAITAYATISDNGQIVLQGRILNAITHEPVIGASIYLSDDKIGTVADADGNYSISNVSSGHHVIEISSTGYSTLIEHVELTASTVKNFYLNPVVVENQTVFLSSTIGKSGIKRAAIPIVVMKHSSLLESASTNLIDALSKIPGISQVTTGPAISKPVIRGLGSNRVVVVSDGVRQEGQQWGDEHGIELDEMSVSKVEVLKGPASILYGSDALAGVLNVVTYSPVSTNTAQANISGGYQSNNRLFAFNESISGNKNGNNWNFYHSSKTAADYRNKYDGIVFNSRFRENNFGGYYGINRKWGYSHFLFSSFNQNLGVVEGTRSSSTGEFLVNTGTSMEHVASNDELHSRNLSAPYQKIEHNKIVSDNNFVIGQSRLKATISYQQNNRKEFSNPFNLDDASLNFGLNTVQYNFQWKFPEFKEWHVDAGTSGMWQQSVNKGNEVLIPAYKLFDKGVFVFVQHFHNKFAWSGGLRIDDRFLHSSSYWENGSARFISFEREFRNWSGSAGLNYTASSNLTLRLNVARGFRAPSIAELGSNGAHEGTNRYEYGNKTLNSESSWQLDGGFELGYEHFSINVSAFKNSISQFIFYRKLKNGIGADSLVNVDGKDLQAFIFDQQSANLVGVEATIDIHPHPIHWLHFENSFSFVRGKFNKSVDGSYNLPLVPPMHWDAELRAELSRAIGRFEKVYFKFDADTYSSQENYFAGFETETRTPGYCLLNAGLGGDYYNKEKRKVFSLHFSVANLGNTAWQSHLSRLKYTDTNLQTGRNGVFNAGRNFSIKFEYPITWKI
jgi:iron complex outermembrane receptor protein